MDDKDKDLELPGFKINYNWGDEPSEEDTAMREGDGGGNDVEATADAAKAVPVGDRFVENGSVAHGEGENKPVMLENESLGGLNETALKTAPGGLKTESEGLKTDFGGSEGQFAGDVGEVAGGSAGDGAGVGSEKQGITEAEARAMLIEDNARAKEDLKKANAKGRKTLVVVIILAVVLIIAGIAVSVILGGRDKDGNDKQEGNGENAAVVEKPEEVDEPEAELVELSLDDEVVQRVYANFQGIANLFDGWWDFYVDAGARAGEIGREEMLRLAGANVWGSPCLGSYEYGNGGKVENECASGEAVRQKVAEMFGEHVDLVEDDKLRSFCGGMVYDVINDEFHQVGNGCGGASSQSLARLLTKAESKGDNLYLYEKVIAFDGQQYFHIGDEEVFGEKIGEYTMPESEFQTHEEYDDWIESTRREIIETYGDEFKWMFRKNEEGDYVFEGLEKVN